MPKQQHLREIQDKHGTGSGTRRILKLVEEGLQKADYQRRLQRIRDKGTDEKTNPWITDVAQCPRKVVLSLMNHPETEPLTTNSLITFGIGHAVEDWLAKVFGDQGAEVMREQRVEIPLGTTIVSGRADFLIGLPRDSILIELKSTNSRAMGFMLRSGEEGKEEHRRQLGLYLYASHLGLLGRKFNKGYLVYCVKDSTKGEPPLHAFEVPFDELQARRDLASLVDLKKKADNKVLPGIPFGYQKTKYPCLYCPFKSYCWTVRGGK